MSITRIGIKNFRCIKSMDLKLPPLTVVVGPNGAGKSTLLGSFRLLSSLSRRELSTAFVHYGGFDASLCWHSSDDDMALKIGASTKISQLDYSVVLIKAGNAHFVAAEQLESTPLDGKNLVAQDSCFLPDLSTLQVSAPTGKTAKQGYILRTSEDGGEWCSDGGQLHHVKMKRGTEAHFPAIAPHHEHARLLAESLQRISYWSASELSLDAAIRKPQSLQPAVSPSQNGDNLLSVLYTVKTEQRDRYQDLIESLQVAFPELDSIELPLAGKGFASLNWWQKGMKRALDAQQLSDGTLRLLWLLTVLYTVPDDGLLLIDEPEISLHPQWLMVLVSLLRETSARTQIIVATHSDQLVRWLKPDELLLADVENGVSRFTWANEVDNLDDWLKEYTLDRLWLMGELGGRS